MEEIFKQSEFEGYYVSNLGRVKSVKRKEEKMLSVSYTKGGFAQVCVFLGSKLKTPFIARMVLSTFEGYPADPWLCVVRHLNGDLKDCRLENLKWEVCETTSEYDPSKSHRKGVLKPDLTKNNMSWAKYNQSEETIRKAVESRKRTYEQRRKA